MASMTRGRHGRDHAAVATADGLDVLLVALTVTDEDGQEAQAEEEERDPPRPRPPTSSPTSSANLFLPWTRTSDPPRTP